ncbi:lysophospholipid acyltransferase family protein [Actinomycetota bacterium]
MRLFIGPPLRLATRLRVEGREHLPATGPAIIASNHLSFVDSMVIPLASGRMVHFLGKIEYFQGEGLSGRLTKAFHEASGTIGVDRSDPRAAAASMKVSEQVLRDGGAFGIYPEGTRSPDGRLHRGRTGVARLHVATGAPIIPCAVEGTDRVQPPGTNGFRPAKVTVRFGPPIDVEPLHAAYVKAALLRAITDATMESIGALSGQEQSGRYASDVKAERGA